MATKAEEMLAELWIAATDREAARRAVDKVDVQLKNDRKDQGESRTGDLRILFEPPLAFHFKVFEKDRKVLVLRVWHTRRPI